MKWWQRQFKKYFGVTATHVAVRSQLPWYWRALQWVLLILLGFCVAMWVQGRYAVDALQELDPHKHLDMQTLQVQNVQLESQLKVASAAQSQLAKELATLQDENMHLKEESAFYKSILNESGTGGAPKIHSVQLNKTGRPGEYRYQILLVQSGRHDKMIQGSLRLMLNATQDGKPLQQHVESAAQRDGIKVNFKYYQKIEGVFQVPSQMTAQNLLVQYMTVGSSQPVLTQTASLPN
jgi:hypothetical protein